MKFQVAGSVPSLKTGIVSRKMIISEAFNHETTTVTISCCSLDTMFIIGQRIIVLKLTVAPLFALLKY